MTHLRDLFHQTDLFLVKHLHFSARCNTMYPPTWFPLFSSIIYGVLNCEWILLLCFTAEHFVWCKNFALEEGTLWGFWWEILLGIVLNRKEYMSSIILWNFAWAVNTSCHVVFHGIALLMASLYGLVNYLFEGNWQCNMRYLTVLIHCWMVDVVNEVFLLLVFIVVLLSGWKFFKGDES